MRSSLFPIASRPPADSPSVLILCADDAIAEALIRELASRRYQPLVGRPNWTVQAALEWARPVAVVVDAHHPAALSERLLAASDGTAVGLVLFGESAPDGSHPMRRASKVTVSTVPTFDAQLIGGAVDAAVGRTT